VQRYACDRCGKSFSESQPLASVRVDFNQACQAVRLFAEGLGVRAVCRLTNLDKETVLHVLVKAGEHCADLLDQKIVNLKPEPLEIDECWTFVKNKRALKNTVDAGDFYAFLASGKQSKLVLSNVVGKRTKEVASDFMLDIRTRLAGRYQITSDSWTGFIRGVLDTSIHKADYATQSKKFTGYNLLIKDSLRRYSPGKCVGVRTRIVCGNPDRDEITTSHAERLNLSLRHFNKRFTRLTPCFSRKVDNLVHSVALTVAYFNFCRNHTALKIKATETTKAQERTPATAAGLTDHTWTIAELLQSAI
jgi:IS1 family transposase